MKFIEAISLLPDKFIVFVACEPEPNIILFQYNSEQDRKYNLPTERVINGFLMSTKYSSHQRALFMGFKDLRFMEYANKMKSQNKWLGIEVGMLDSGELKIQVKKIDGIREALAG